VTAPLPRRDRDTRQTADWRRRDAAYACPPAEDGVRDPLDRLPKAQGPSTYSLPATVLYRHAATLATQGWAPWELHRRFKLRAVPTHCP
jgi:hypothetical protein